MNLVKLFNFNYLKQNVKKSKGLLAVLILVIPVITAFNLIGSNASNYISATYPFAIALPNILGMYCIPVIISYILYGYVYKKNSVDFVGSMPLTRSTIFTTNFIGGIALILALQLLTLIATLALGAVLPNVYVTCQMVFDIFIVMFIAYAFVFSATSMAMAVSGNFVTQIVVTMLVLFLIPFVFGVGTITIDKTLSIDIGEKLVTVDAEKISNYTLPSSLFIDTINGNATLYSFSKNIKTVAITAIYFVIGLFLFNKRKMENVNFSFAKLWVHLVVKGITLVPMVFVLEMAILDNVFFAISVVLIFVYYCIYDFVTARKVPVKWTILGFVVTFVVLVGVYKGLMFCETKIYDEKISIDDIVGISVVDRAYNFGSSIYNGMYDHDIEIYVEDKDFIKTICGAVYNRQDKYWEQEDWEYVSIDFKLKDGSKRYAYVSLKQDVAEQAILKTTESKEYIEKYKEVYALPENSYIIQNYKFVSDKDTKEIIDIFNNIDIERKMAVEKEFSSLTNKSNYMPSANFDLYYYKNHDLRQIQINPFLSQELFDKLNELSKKSVIADLDKIKGSEEENDIGANIDEKRKNARPVYSEEYIGFERTDNLVKYIREHADEKFDMTDSFYIVSINVIFGYNSIFLKETDELNAIIEKDKRVDYYDETDGIVYTKEMEDTKVESEKVVEQ